MSKAVDKQQNDSQGYQRRTLRLQDYDYSQAGAYFVTVCAYMKQPLLGDIKKGAIELSEVGRLTKRCWLAIPQHFANVSIDEYVIMPNHFHGIIAIHEKNIHGGKAADCILDHRNIPRRGKACLAPTRATFGHPVAGSLGIIVGSFKSAVTKAVHEYYEPANSPIWQRNYYDHIIRNETDLFEKRKYIIDNPAKWDEDEYYQNNLSDNNRHQ